MRLPFTQCGKCKKTQCRVCAEIDKKYYTRMQARQGRIETTSDTPESVNPDAV